jgi:hypothetical protein
LIECESALCLLLRSGVFGGQDAVAFGVYSREISLGSLRVEIRGGLLNG